MLLIYESFAHFIDHLLKPIYLIAYTSMSLSSLTKQDEIYSEELEKLQGKLVLLILNSILAARMDDMVLQESWSGPNNVCNLLRTIWGTSYLNGRFEAKPQVYCIPKESKREIRPPY